MRKAPNPEWDVVMDMMWRNRMTSRLELSREVGMKDQTMRNRQNKPGTWLLCELARVFDVLGATDEEIVSFMRTYMKGMK